jgi:glycosyltransferase involved in cell wall biosynthesis
MSAQTQRISVVLPTFNRLAALRENFHSLQELSGISEIVVVVDGSTDGTQGWLEQLADPRIRVIEQRQRGSPAARNAGIAAALGDWILMTEDDCYLPQDFAVTLLDVAQSLDAQIVSAPWLAVEGAWQMPGALERGRRSAQPRIHLGTHPSVFPTDDLQTPFLNGIVLARRDVFDLVRYDESLGGNAWREETSMFLTAVAAGLRCVLTPRTASFQLGQWEGGQRRSRLAYEVWAIRNNWRFLRKHQQTLERFGEIHDPISAQARFVAKRLADTVTGYSLGRWQALRRDRDAAARPAGDAH